MEDVRRMRPLSRAESLRLLRSVSYGRVVFTHLALPAIRPVNHILDEADHIIIRAQAGSTVAATVAGGAGAVVAYEADELDPVRRLGWSVIVVGRARLLTDPEDVTRYQRAPASWVAADHGDLVAIQPDLVDGFRLGPAAA